MATEMFGTMKIRANQQKDDPWYVLEVQHLTWQIHSNAPTTQPFVLWNITDSSGNNFFVKQPQLWAINIMNGTNLSFENITSSAVSNNAPAGSNWVQNADGFSKYTVLFMLAN